MKAIILIIILTLQLQILAQETVDHNIKINYNINYNTEMPITKKGTLYIDKSYNKSLFIYGKKKDESIKIEEDNGISVKHMYGQSVKFNYYNQEKDTLLSKDKVFENKFIISEKSPSFNWKLIDEEKKIDSILVRKATLNFRGRNFIAWYSTKYPIKFGPWKFNNLPGLIIEIYDETLRYHWVVTSIEKSNNFKSIDIESMLQNNEQISMKEFVYRRYYKDMPSRDLSSRLPRGTTITKTSTSKRQRNGIEIKFEWEKEKKK